MTKQVVSQEAPPPIIRPSLSEIGQDMVRYYGAFAILASFLAILIDLRN